MQERQDPSVFGTAPLAVYRLRQHHPVKPSQKRPQQCKVKQQTNDQESHEALAALADRLGGGKAQNYSSQLLIVQQVGEFDEQGARDRAPFDIVGI